MDYNHPEVLTQTPAEITQTLTDPAAVTFCIASYDPGQDGSIVDFYYSLNASTTASTLAVPALYCGTAADDATVGSIAWANPTNAQDNTPATVAVAALLDTEVSHYLKCTNFGFAIPTAATIVGITVTAKISNSGVGQIDDSSIKIVKGGSISGDDKADAVVWSDADKPWGGSTDLWGLSWTAADINASTFGVAISGAASSGDETANIHYVKIEINYTIPVVAEWRITPQGGAVEVLATETLDWAAGADMPEIALDGFKVADDFTAALVPFTIKLALTWAGTHTVSITPDVTNNIRAIGAIT